MYQAAVEAELAHGLEPPVAVPTILLTLLLVPAQLTLLGLGLGGAASPWLLTLPLGIGAYLFYTPAHEAIHRNIVRAAWFEPVNALIGWWAALLTGMTWPLLRRTHLAHHIHTNGERDPDAFVQGSLPRLCAMAAVSVLTNLVPVPLWRLVYRDRMPNLGYLDAWKVMPAREWRQHQLVHGVMCMAVWSAVVAGHAGLVFALYVVPATIGRLLMGIFLSWMPHRPFISGDRYTQASLHKGRLLAVASAGHSMHLIHHLWPRVPFYRYHALYRRLAPLLHERGVTLR